MKNIFKITLLAVSLMSILFVGCDEKDDLGDPDRLFRPIFQETSVGGQWIKIQWDIYEGVDKTILEISTVVDSFSTVIQNVETTDYNYTFEGLDYDTQYYVRIKSVGPTLESSFSVSDIIKTDDYPTKLLDPESNDMIDVAIKVSWLVDTPVYDQLVVVRVSNDSIVKTIDITAAQYDIGQIIVSGLETGTSYYVKAYSAEEYQGKKKFTTLEPQVFEGATVDLRGLSEEEALSALNPTLVDSAESGTTFILDGGVTYNITSTIELTKGVHFVTGLSFYGKAIIAIDSNFDLIGTETTDVSFKDIFFTEGSTKKRDADSNYGGTYIMNVSNSDALATSVTLEGCTVKYKRGLFRIKAANVQINSITINDCQIDSVAGYGLVNVDASNVMVNNISVTNSTISHAQKLIVNSKGLDNESVIFSNNTVFSSPNGGIYMLDLNGKAVGSIEFKNNLLGPAYDACNGIRSSSANISVDGNYMTNDFLWALNAGTGLPNAAIDPIETTISSTELFVDPMNFDFTLTMNLKVGDPRWWNGLSFF